MMNRRRLIGTGAAALAGSALAGQAQAAPRAVRIHGGEDYSPKSGTKRRSVPTACGQCPAACPALGYVEQGRVVKIEGHPGSRRTLGRLCARGQAGVNQANDPDRLTRPLRRAGRRGEGLWTPISWKEALDEIAARLRGLREAGHPERFALVHGHLPDSARLIAEALLARYGSGSLVAADRRGQRARRLAGELIRGKRDAGWHETWDLEQARYVLVLGANPLEASENHVALAARLARRIAEGRARLVTVDVRLSNTAARSQRWVPIRPGTDLALVLAMAQVVIEEGLYRGAGEALLERCRVSADPAAGVADKIALLARHLAPYTPRWAAGITGIEAATIRELARELVSEAPACILSGRGASGHANGVETERAILMLAALTGNLERPGTRRSVRPPIWQAPELPRLAEDAPRLAALAEEGAGRGLLGRLAAGPERPEVLLWYGCNPAFSEPDAEASARLLGDPKALPFTVAVTPFYDESAALADLILPDASYLERWDWSAVASPDGSREYVLAQPLLAPPGEARDFKDVALELAGRLGLDLGVESSRALVEAACEATPAVAEAGGLEYLMRYGLVREEPRYRTLEELTLELRSERAAALGLGALPAWRPLAWPEAPRSDELVLTGFKVNVHTLSRTGNCKWLDEIAHRGEAWMHPYTAGGRGIGDGDAVRIGSPAGEIEATARVSGLVVPGVVAMAAHGGHWEYGRYASGRRAPGAGDDRWSEEFQWWRPSGGPVNRVIPDRHEPLSGQPGWMDALVTVRKA